MWQRRYFSLRVAALALFLLERVGTVASVSVSRTHSQERQEEQLRRVEGKKAKAPAATKSTKKKKAKEEPPPSSCTRPSLFGVGFIPGLLCQDFPVFLALAHNPIASSTAFQDPTGLVQVQANGARTYFSMELEGFDSSDPSTWCVVKSYTERSGLVTMIEVDTVDAYTVAETGTFTTSVKESEPLVFHGGVENEAPPPPGFYQVRDVSKVTVKKPRDPDNTSPPVLNVTITRSAGGEFIDICHLIDPSFD